MSAGELSLANDEWAWLLTPADFLRERAADVTLPWWPTTSPIASGRGTQTLLLLLLAVAAAEVVAVVVVVLVDDDSDDVNVLSSSTSSSSHNNRSLSNFSYASVALDM